MTNQSFADAQQAGDVAYAMTLEQTGDTAKASDAYKAVMTSYFEADAKRQQPAYDRDFYAGIIAARMNDPRQHEDGQVSLPDMMLLTGRIDHAQWMALVWPTLPEIAY